MMVVVDSYIYMCIDSWWFLLRKINIKVRITKFSPASQILFNRKKFFFTNKLA
nr:MAG TPA: hypothetical protein [Caudoviricetes sp.]